MRAFSLLGRALGVCLALALAAILAIIAVAAFPVQDGVDFYHFWGIAAARKAHSLEASPYRDPAAYAGVLNAIAESSPDAKLRRANQKRREIEPTATPFLYAAFAAMPADYGTAQAWHVVLSYAAGLWAVWALARLRGFGPRTSVCLALLVALTFHPFTLDVTVSNVNLLQLGVCAALLCVAARKGAPSLAVESLALAAALAGVVFKPNFVFIAGAYALQRFLVLDRRLFVRAIAPALAAAVLCVAAGAVYFGDASVWTEWAHYASRLGANDAMNLVARGNQSLAMWLAQLAGSAHPGGFGFGLAAILALAVAAAGGPRGALPASLRAAFSDPMLAMSFAVLLTFAISPLVWIHYMVLALIPIMWLLRGNGPIASAAAVIAYLGMARPTSHALESLGLHAHWETVEKLAWLALVPGLLLVLRSRAPLVRNPSR